MIYKIANVFLVFIFYSLFFFLFFIFCFCFFFFFFSSRRRHTRCGRDWSSDVCSSDLANTSNNAAGDINLNASISWSANTLTLRADRNIHINAAQYGSGTAGLALEYGQGAKASGNGADYYVNAPVNLSKTGSFSTKLGSDGAVRNYTIITELGEAGSFRNNQGLQGIETGSGDFVLGADINASSTASWAYQNYSKSGKGFKPLDYSNGLYFDGLGHRIDGLTIINSTEYGIGLFSKVDNGSIRNLGLTNAKFNIDNGLEGRNIVGLLIG